MIYVFIKYLCFLCIQFNLFIEPAPATGPRYVFFSALQKRIFFLYVFLSVREHAEETQLQFPQS